MDSLRNLWTKLDINFILIQIFILIIIFIGFIKLYDYLVNHFKIVRALSKLPRAPGWDPVTGNLMPLIIKYIKNDVHINQCKSTLN